ncbi:MAG: paraquat-inducible protein A [Gammaproteobacteria bacterium]
MTTITRYFYYPLAAALAGLIMIEAGEAQRLAQAAAEMQSLAGSTRLVWAELLERLSLSLYTGASDLKEAYVALAEGSRSAAASAARAAFLFAAASGAQLAWVAWTARGRPRLFAWHLNLVAVVAFAVGIGAPMLTVVAQAEIPVLGDVILRYDAKSICSTVATLARDGNLLLAVLIGGFSIVVPLAKVGLVACALQTGQPATRRRSLAALHTLGKWSMADVFVVAVLVAFLALDKDVHSRAALGVGLYFFIAYCLLSMLASHWAERTAT